MILRSQSDCHLKDQSYFARHDLKTLRKYLEFYNHSKVLI